MTLPHIAELSVKDLALVSELRLSLRSGLTVLSGETGAGKSMLVDALLAASGGRVASGLVREGAERAVVEVVFAQAKKDGDDLVLTREIAAGRSPARIDQRAVPVSALAETGADLVAVHGQGDQLRLARPAVQRDTLDAYGRHDELRQRAADAHRAMRELQDERARLGGDPRERARRAELLAHEVDEIRGAKLRDGEDDDLRAALAVARSAERLRAAAHSVQELLAGDRASARDRLAIAERELRVAAELDERLRPFADRLLAQVEEADGLATELRRHADGIEVDPAHLAELEAREDLLYELRRKYGETTAEVRAHGERAAAELEALRHSEERLATIDADERRARDRLTRAAKALHDARESVGATIAKAVESH